MAVYKHSLAEAELLLKKAQAVQQAALAKLARARNLRAANAISVEEMEDLRLASQLADIDVELAKNKLGQLQQFVPYSQSPGAHWGTTKEEPGK